MTTFPWAKLPTDWIYGEELRRLTWGEFKSNATAAMALYIALTIKANRDGIENKSTVVARAIDKIETVASYDVLQDYTLLARSKVSAGLRVLRCGNLVEALGNRRTRRYRIGGCRDKNRWTMLPQSPWYRGSDGIAPLRSFTYRSKTELSALKLYLLLATFRNTRTKLTNLSYSAISGYSGIDRRDIRSAISLLIHYNLIQVVRTESIGEPLMAYNSYKLTGLSLGPTGRAELE